MDTHRALPLSEADFLDFVYNYFKAEYAPIRWLFTSTAEAVPKQAQRFIFMGNELFPTSWRPANPQTQGDLESLDYCIRKWKLDATFVQGMVVRYAKHQKHERLEKRLYEVGRKDLMVCKALKEKHLIDALWPSPAPANLPKELLQQGVEVRRWYGDMFFKYFRSLHAIDDFTLRPEVEQKIKIVGVNTLVPYVEHILAGPVEPIRRIVSNGTGFANAPGKKEVRTFGKPERFEIRFDSPGEVENTMMRSVVRQCQCLKCGTVRDVQVAVLIDPVPSNPNTSARRHHPSKVSQRYTPGYNMPGTHDEAPQQPPAPHLETYNATTDVRPPSPVQKKQCPACTFLNHPELTTCEMCQSALPEAVITKPPSPVQRKTLARKPSHAHSVSMPTNSRTEGTKEDRPNLLNRVNRYSMGLGSTLLSYSPFAQEQQPEQRPQMEQTNQSATTPKAPVEPKQPPPQLQRSALSEARRETAPIPPQTSPTIASPELPKSPWDEPAPSTPPEDRPEPSLSHHPEMTLMPLTPPPATDSARRLTPLGMPQSLMDDYVPITPPVVRDEVEDAGWGEVSRDEARKAVDSDGEDEEGSGRTGMLDLDAIAQEEVGVWGEREDD
ncbi:hypothetical protein BU23DRAFT_456235 [Bimuria novae-zelandiae CBS 107.79]|uniref:RanBP2-type domain-containing protein n=1 Tax=Bimuria novae-zelandiae CBS 107.79 TaxID=1447943 RepID=A0A6A5VGE6_9PLEO|nr:hypothetical protein BU23DRAFT_456235 [Bimuria novae-zelandiae CBS 107.79]